MANPFSDTNPAVERLQFELMRQAPAWRKLQLLGQLNQTLQALALGGLRQRYPQAGEEEIRRRLADLMLGAALAEKVYGPAPQERHAD